MILKLFIFNLIGCSGFIPRSPLDQSLATRHQGDEVSLWAKPAKKKNKQKKSAAASSAGGFGARVEEKKPKKDFDYSVFPALEPQVSATLVPSPLELAAEAGELPAEIYDRLDQIYGFRNFNHEKVEGDSSSQSLSFDELISSTDSSKTSSSNNVAKSTMSAGNFADLLASATGGSVDISSSTSNTKEEREDSKIDAISSLPPFTKFRVLHVDPMVVAIDDFLTPEECDRYVDMSTNANEKNDDGPFQTRSMTVGKDAVAKSQRTSTTWFHHYKNVPELMAKASRLLGLDTIDQFEEPQTVRYVHFYLHLGYRKY